MHKLVIPLLSALAGASLVLTLARIKPHWVFPSTLSKAQEKNRPAEERNQAMIEHLLEKQKEMHKDLDSFFDDDFFQQRDSISSLRSFREQMEQMREKLLGQSDAPFDSWFSERFGGGSVYDIQSYEDDQFLYYEIDVPNADTTNIQTQVEHGQLTITGETLRQKKDFQEPGSHALQHSYSSKFTRSLPLPTDVDETQMEVSQEGDKLKIKFPKRTL